MPRIPIHKKGPTVQCTAISIPAYKKNAPPRQCGRSVKLLRPTDSTEGARCYLHANIVSVKNMPSKMASKDVPVADGPEEGDTTEEDDAVGKSEEGVEAEAVDSGKTS